MTTSGTWYPPSAGTGGLLLTNPPFAPMPQDITTGDTLYKTPRHEPWPHWEVTVYRAPGGNLPIVVRFLCMGRAQKRLDQCAAWLPVAQGWDQTRWAPNRDLLPQRLQRRRVPAAVLAAVECRLKEARR